MKVTHRISRLERMYSRLGWQPRIVVRVTGLGRERFPQTEQDTDILTVRFVDVEVAK